ACLDNRVASVLLGCGIPLGRIVLELTEHHEVADSDFEGIKQPIIDAVNRALGEGSTDTYQLQQVVRRTIGRWVSNTHKRRPMIIPVVVEA
ncbi:MAG TPA: hypothetical protein VNS46_16995, partial [Nocardioides sp.]|nr:hypothetical protein [Nocardioides sp.]